MTEYATACTCHCRADEHEADVEDGVAIMRCTVRDRRQPYARPWSCDCVYSVYTEPRPPRCVIGPDESKCFPEHRGEHAWTSECDLIPRCHAVASR
jgi:hypothetical protein